MGQVWRGALGALKRHDRKSIPVPRGTIVEVFTEADPATARDGIFARVGIAGIGLVRSWYWTPRTTLVQRSLPIDWYRVMRPRAWAVALSSRARVHETA